MAIAITVPRLDWSMEEGTFVEWRKHDGDTIRPGDFIYVLESEKAAQEIEALDAGILRIPPDGPKPGEVVKVGQVIGFLAAAGESVAALDVGSRSVPAAASKATDAALQKATPVAGPAVRRLARSLAVDITNVVGTGPGGRILESDIRQQIAATSPATKHRHSISPRARRVARELGIDWSSIQGGGGNGRIRERDIRAAQGAAAGQLLPHTQMRRTIAARMVAGHAQGAPVTLTTKADATNLVNIRKQFKMAATAGDIVPTYTDLIVKLTAVALKKHPLLQAQWRDTGLFVPHKIDIAIAVDTEAGLLVPVMRTADALPLRQIAAQSHDLATRARAGTLTAEQMRDATFTITNLGGFGIDAFTPILNPPQCAVLGVGRIMREPAVVEDQIVPRDMATLSLTFDHRIVDGAPAARFLATLRECLEQPAAWLM
ncbi:MAG TPA: dihydrolipoamide acetyltransferase family protein [Gemmataceae bacterium]|nr:dihydrolipoamide acetyltransferase family protein [Gemmataceae bacterium]